MEKQLIIVPAYKPTNILVDFCKQLGKHFRQIVVVDDGSGDEYQSIFNEIENIDLHDTALLRKHGKRASIKNRI